MSASWRSLLDVPPGAWALAWADGVDVRGPDGVVMLEPPRFAAPDGRLALSGGVSPGILLNAGFTEWRYRLRDGMGLSAGTPRLPPQGSPGWQGKVMAGHRYVEGLLSALRRGLEAAR